MKPHSHFSFSLCVWSPWEVWQRLSWLFLSCVFLAVKYLGFPEPQPPLNPTQFALISQLLPPPVPQPHWSPPPVELSHSLPVLLGMWERLESAAGVWEPFYYFYLEFVPGPLCTHLTGALLTAEAAGEPGRLPSDLTPSAVSPTRESSISTTLSHWLFLNILAPACLCHITFSLSRMLLSFSLFGIAL